MVHRYKPLSLRRTVSLDVYAHNSSPSKWICESQISFLQVSISQSLNSKAAVTGSQLWQRRSPIILASIFAQQLKCTLHTARCTLHTAQHWALNFALQTARPNVPFSVHFENCKQHSIEHKCKKKHSVSNEHKFTVNIARSMKLIGLLLTLASVHCHQKVRYHLL